MASYFKPTDAEKKNGWTAETLYRYIKDRDKAASISILGDWESNRIERKQKRPEKCNNNYSPHRWMER